MYSHCSRCDLDGYLDIRTALANHNAVAATMQQQFPVVVAVQQGYGGDR